MKDIRTKMDDKDIEIGDFVRGSPLPREGIVSEGHVVRIDPGNPPTYWISAGITPLKPGTVKRRHIHYRDSEGRRCGPDGKLLNPVQGDEL